MMYSEFIEHVGCYDNEHNYNMYKLLEQVYMDSEVTKEQVYKFAKKCCDFREPEKNRKIRLELECELMQVEQDIELYKNFIQFNIEHGDTFGVQFERENLRQARQRQAEIKFILGK